MVVSSPIIIFFKAFADLKSLAALSPTRPSGKHLFFFYFILARPEPNSILQTVSCLTLHWLKMKMLSESRMLRGDVLKAKASGRPSCWRLLWSSARAALLGAQLSATATSPPTTQLRRTKAAAGEFELSPRSSRKFSRSASSASAREHGDGSLMLMTRAEEAPAPVGKEVNPTAPHGREVVGKASFLRARPGAAGSMIFPHAGEDDREKRVVGFEEEPDSSSTRRASFAMLGKKVGSGLETRRKEKKRTQEQEQAPVTIEPPDILFLDAGSYVTIEPPDILDARSYVTIDLVKSHNTKKSCWVIIHGKALDITAWISVHPGGHEPFDNKCGTDMTSDFQNKHGDANSLRNRIEHNSNKILLKGDVAAAPGVAVPVVSPVITIDLVMSHNTAQSCWVIIHGKALDITAWISAHPGGRGPFDHKCGTDMTSAFQNKHGDVTSLLNRIEHNSQKILLKGDVDMTGAVASPVITIDLVKSHNTAQSCWVIIHGKALDITAWISAHPGGAGAFDNKCGTDMTSEFQNKHGDVKSLLNRIEHNSQKILLKGDVDMTGAVASPVTTIDLVKSHNTTQSCWVIIHGKALDITTWISAHPGGPGPFEKKCGTDMTSDFQNKHGDVKSLLTRIEFNSKKILLKGDVDMTGAVTTIDLVKSHNTKKSCWVIIHGKALDITAWISEHPGGAGAFDNKCGTDMTSDFQNKHGDVKSLLNRIEHNSQKILLKGDVDMTGAVAAPVITIDLVKSHNTSQSCWVIIHGKALDITAWISAHPGGPGPFDKKCGTDMTSDFQNKHGDVKSLLTRIEFNSKKILLKGDVNITAPVITIDLVKSHNTKKSCWVIIHGKALDITAWISAHPGGHGPFDHKCGTDMTSDFQNKHGDVKSLLNRIEHNSQKILLKGDVDMTGAVASDGASSSDGGCSACLAIGVVLVVLLLLGGVGAACVTGASGRGGEAAAAEGVEGKGSSMRKQPKVMQESDQEE